MKHILLLCAATLAWSAAAAQDLIVRTDSTRIEARVAEVSPETIRYKRFAAPDGPTYVLPVARIAYIRYADGFLERYAAAAAPAAEAPNAAQTAPSAVPTPAAPATTAPAAGVPAASVPATPVVAATAPAPAAAAAPAIPATPAASAPTLAAAPAAPAAPATAAAPSATPVPLPAQPATTPAVRTLTQPAAPTAAPLPAGYAPLRYELGQVCEIGGRKGIVVEIDEEGLHGLLVSVDETVLPWSTFRKPDFRLVGAADRIDGRRNMEAVARYIEAHGASWDDFPAFKWCREQGEGWYLPSIDELMKIGHVYNGGSRLRNDRPARTAFNERLKANGGERLNGKAYYHSSTELDEKFPLMSHMGLEAPYVVEEVQKYVSFNVRAVYRF